MDLRYINTFHTIVEAGGFNKAAEKLCYTQSTLRFMLVSWRRSLVCSFSKSRQAYGFD